MIYEIRQGRVVAPLFKDWQETMIWSCLQNVMGHLYATSTEQPDAAMAILGDFCFFAGRPNRELVGYKPEWCRQDFIIMVPETSEWGDLIESVWQEHAKKVIRYAMKKEADVFSEEKLQRIVASLSPEYCLKRIDRELFELCSKIAWCRDLVSVYESYEQYAAKGLGIVVLRDREVVSGASSYTAYDGGIEIEIDTRSDYRRRGLAAVCGAKLILECVERGWYPSWDAQNLWSVSLAEKLGYHFSHEYTAYEIYGYQGGDRPRSQAFF